MDVCTDQQHFREPPPIRVSLILRLSYCGTIKEDSWNVIQFNFQCGEGHTLECMKTGTILFRSLCIKAHRYHVSSRCARTRLLGIYTYSGRISRTIISIKSFLSSIHADIRSAEVSEPRVRRRRYAKSSLQVPKKGSHDVNDFFFQHTYFFPLLCSCSAGAWPQQAQSRYSWFLVTLQAGAENTW